MADAMRACTCVGLFLACVLLATGACDDGDGAPARFRPPTERVRVGSPVTDAVELVRSSAAVTIDGEAGDLGQVLEVIAVTPDTILIVDAFPPFLRLFNRRGEGVGAALGEGGGPDQIAAPGFAAVRGDTLAMLAADNSLVLYWDLRAMREISRDRLEAGDVVNAVELVSACDGLAIVYRGRTPGSEPGTALRMADARYGVRVRSPGETGGWTDVSDLVRMGRVFTPNWSEFRAIGTEGGVLLFDWFAGSVQTISCTGAPTEELAIEASATSLRFPVRAQGLALPEGSVVVAARPRDVRSDPATLLFLATAPPGMPHRALALSGEWNLHDESAGMVWLVRNEAHPTVFGVPANALIDILRGEDT